MGVGRVAYQGKQFVSGQTPGKKGREYYGGSQPPKVPIYQMPPEPPKRKVRWFRLFAAILLVMLVFGLTGMAAYGWYLERKVVESDASERPALSLDQPVNVLVVGVDRDVKSGDPQRRSAMNTDVLIFAHLDPVKKKAFLLSIPRDTRVQLPTGPEKINAAYAIGGMDRLKKTVMELTGMTVDRYLMIDFPAFVQMIDALGGVEFNVDKPLFNPEGTVSLKPGKQRLTGEQALTVVRFRHEELGDIARVQRQQQFLAAVGAKLRESDVLDWVKGLRAMSDSLRTDMTIGEMGALLTAMQGQEAEWVTHTLPGEFFSVYGVSYWKANRKELQNLTNQFGAVSR
jgi:LCP family protein required for cell wall assembly